jgi:hypothetical protein
VLVWAFKGSDNAVKHAINVKEVEVAEVERQMILIAPPVYVAIFTVIMSGGDKLGFWGVPDCRRSKPLQTFRSFIPVVCRFLTSIRWVRSISPYRSYELLRLGVESAANWRQQLCNCLVPAFFSNFSI